MSNDLTQQLDLDERNALRFCDGRPGICTPPIATVERLCSWGLVAMTDPSAWVAAERYSPTTQGTAMLAAIGERG